MTQPILFKNSVSIAVLATIESALAACLGVSSLMLTANALLPKSEDLSASLWIASLVIVLVLVRRPHGAGDKLSIEAGQSARSVLVRFFVAATLLWFLGKELDSPLTTGSEFWIWVSLTAPLLTLITYIISRITQRLLLVAAHSRKAVFAGYNQVSMALADRLARDRSLCLEACGYFDDRSSERLGMPDHIKLQGSLKDLPGFAKEHQVDVIFITLPLRNIKRVMDLLDDLRDTTASVYYAPDVFVSDLIQSRSTDIDGVPVIAMCETPFYGYRGISKRLLDMLVSSIALIMLMPLLALIALAIKATSPGPIIFKQRRYGLDGREIAVYKFRSMRVTENGAQVKQATKNDSRITPVGGFLRRSSLDELPQLFNVLQGKMSLVGPRPHAVAHNEEYRKLIKGYMLRHKVPPGITGLAQISGCRGETAKLEDMERRVKYDIEYLRYWSLWLDIKIIFLTAFKIFRDDQAY